ncbi:MAG TPA: STAS domain-containing protein [Leptospiraceae bacterium]|nr:STAS domain-containing protein [Leptospiraceae bacterium]HMZ60720.1 STAS domain-containing protein [Leptospiraceae bacterium]HNF15017.1 STAS domain-containing protein [Leptospiraceae bacterium]HNF25865.1 STAS domain-containing protein [Leptospiraceae bacterium]HNH09862.1 STAS domain-containing protein [Leptospiraceae bacterium]
MQTLRGSSLMAMQVKKSKENIIVYLSGNMDNKSAHELEMEFEDLLNANSDKNLILNMKEVKYLSSAGLRTIVALRSAMHESGKSLRLCHLKRNVMEVFELTKVSQFFKIYEDEISALSEQEDDEDED